MIHTLISLALFIVGIFIGANFNRTSARMEGFDEGFRAGKESAIMQRKLHNISLYGKVYGRKE